MSHRWLPKVSCVCLTYNRYPDKGKLLEEALQSFVLQDYPRKYLELIVLNDCPQQEIVLGPALDGVKVLNAPSRFASLGEKYNAAIALATGDFIMPWEDDDISLPWRVSQAVAMLGESDYWKPPQVVFSVHGGTIRTDHTVGVRHHAGVFRKSAWKRVGGYPHTSGNQDMLFDARLEAQCSVSHPRPSPTPWLVMPPSQWAYVYRWGVSNAHLSGAPNPEEFYGKVGRMPVYPGRFSLWPKWQTDYVALVKAVVQREFL